jgi:hypothetical protein
MVVDDFDLLGIAILPNETHPPPAIDPDRPLPLAVAPKPFQTVARRQPQIVNLRRNIDREEGTQRPNRDCAESN